MSNATLKAIGLTIAVIFVFFFAVGKGWIPNPAAVAQNG